MCIIVDNNVVAAVFLNGDVEFEPVLQAIRKGRHRLVYGGRLTREYTRSQRLASVLRVLGDAGRCVIVASAIVDSAEKKLVESGVCVSDDAHIVGLAQVTRTRLLCSNDLALIKDFKNKKLLDKPRGNVYRTGEHRKLVSRQCPRCSSPLRGG